MENVDTINEENRIDPNSLYKKRGESRNNCNWFRVDSFWSRRHIQPLLPRTIPKNVSRKRKNKSNHIVKIKTGTARGREWRTKKL
jgi:hypothetical protein